MVASRKIALKCYLSDLIDFLIIKIKTMNIKEILQEIEKEEKRAVELEKALLDNILAKKDLI